MLEQILDVSLYTFILAYSKAMTMTRIFYIVLFSYIIV